MPARPGANPAPALEQPLFSVGDDRVQSLIAIQDRRHDLILMDCHMPGMDAFLSKPHQLEQLCDLLQHWLGDAAAVTAPSSVAAGNP